MKFKIGQEVWVVRDRIKDVKIVDIKDGKYFCSYQNYTTKPYSSQYYWKEETKVILTTDKTEVLSIKNKFKRSVREIH